MLNSQHMAPQTPIRPSRGASRNITIVLAGITLVCSMNQEKIGFKVLLIGGVMAGVGLVGIVYLLFGIVPAIIAGLACILYAIVMILTS